MQLTEVKNVSQQQTTQIHLSDAIASLFEGIFKLCETLSLRFSRNFQNGCSLNYAKLSIT